MQGFLAAILKKKKKESFFFPLGDLCSLVRVDRACEGGGRGEGGGERREGREESKRSKKKKEVARLFERSKLVVLEIETNSCELIHIFEEEFTSSTIYRIVSSV